MSTIHSMGVGKSGQPLTWQNFGSVAHDVPFTSMEFSKAVGAEGLSAFERGLALGFQARRQGFNFGTALDINSRHQAG